MSRRYSFSFLPPQKMTKCKVTAAKVKKNAPLSVMGAKMWPFGLIRKFSYCG